MEWIDLLGGFQMRMSRKQVRCDKYTDFSGEEREHKVADRGDRQMPAEQLWLLTETGAAKDKPETLFWDKRMMP